MSYRLFMRDRDGPPECFGMHSTMRSKQYKEYKLIGNTLLFYILYAMTTDGYYRLIVKKLNEQKNNTKTNTKTTN